MYITPDTLLLELLQAKNNTNAVSKTFKPIVQYYYVVLCEFESEHKWIVGAVPTSWHKLKVFNAIFVEKSNTFNWHIYKKEDIFAWINLSIYLLLQKFEIALLLIEITSDQTCSVQS